MCDVEPTTAGESAVNPFHPYGRVKRLTRKPLSSFKDDEWLCVTLAEKEGLIKATFTDQVWL